jgi:hypothetical protein
VLAAGCRPPGLGVSDDDVATAEAIIAPPDGPGPRSEPARGCPGNNSRTLAVAATSMLRAMPDPLVSESMPRPLLKAGPGRRAGIVRSPRPARRQHFSGLFPPLRRSVRKRLRMGGFAGPLRGGPAGVHGRKRAPGPGPRPRAGNGTSGYPGNRNNGPPVAGRYSSYLGGVPRIPPPGLMTARGIAAFLNVGTAQSAFDGSAKSAACDRNSVAFTLLLWRPGGSEKPSTDRASAGTPEADESCGTGSASRE